MAVRQWLLGDYPQLGILRTDGGMGGEEFFSELSRLRICHERTPPYQHHRAGIVERTIQVIVTDARTLLISADDLSEIFEDYGMCLWSYAMRYAVFLGNRVPMDCHNGKSAHMEARGYEDYRKVYRFGSNIVWIPLHQQMGCRPKNERFAPRGRAGLYLGFTASTRSRVVYDLALRKTAISNNIFPVSREDVSRKLNTGLQNRQEFGLLDNLHRR